MFLITNKALLWPVQINCATVKPLLTDTSRRKTPLVSGHLVKFPATYKPHFFWSRGRESAYGSFDCICTLPTVLYKIKYKRCMVEEIKRHFSVMACHWLSNMTSLYHTLLTWLILAAYTECISLCKPNYDPDRQLEYQLVEPEAHLSQDLKNRPPGFMSYKNIYNNNQWPIVVY